MLRSHPVRLPMHLEEGVRVQGQNGLLGDHGETCSLHSTRVSEIAVEVVEDSLVHVEPQGHGGDEVICPVTRNG